MSRLRRSLPSLASNLLIVILALAGGTHPAVGQATPPPASTPTLTQTIETIWPDHPEWVAMLADILQGSQLGPGEGWFKKSVAQSRYNWDSIQSLLDTDGDGVVARSELPAPTSDFNRLDRSGDGLLNAVDFDFSAHALTPSPGMMLFLAADSDGNGKVTADEFAALFQAFGGQEYGFLALSDFQEAFQMAPRAQGSSSSQGPSRWTLIKGLFTQEIGSLQPGPNVGDLAPDFTLRTVDGKDEVTLSHLIGSKPVVLIFGNFTCGPFRSQAGNIEKLFLHYADRANFVMVYVREAHPTDGWSMSSNERVGVKLAQPRTYNERVQIAQTCQHILKIQMPMLVDSIDDSVGAPYSGMPSRLYLIDPQGRIAYKSARGPFGFKPAELEHALLLLLHDPSTRPDTSLTRSPKDR